MREYFFNHFRLLNAGHKLQLAATGTAFHVDVERIRLGRASAAQPRPEPFVGQARSLPVDAGRVENMYWVDIPMLRFQREDVGRIARLMRAGGSDERQFWHL